MAQHGTATPSLRRRLLAALLPATLLTACQPPGPDAAFATYLQRLGNTLAVAPRAPAGQPLPRPPRSAALRLDLPGSRIDTLDFLSLSGCELQVTIGRRNSSLGRLARDSQRLLLELEYLRLAPACVARLRAQGNDALAATLEQAWRDKREQLPARIFNATLGGEEYRAFWRAVPAPGAYPAVGEDTAAAALAAVNAGVRRWLAGDYRADNRAFEILLGEVAGGNGGALLAALARQQAWLAAADEMLAERAARGPLCAPGIRHRAADILPNVVRRYFVTPIQPQAARQHGGLHALRPPVAELEALLAAALPAAYLDWARARDRRLEAVMAAPRRHVTALQRLLAPCADDAALPTR